MKGFWVSPCGERCPSLRVPDRLQVVIEGVDEGDASGYVELGDCVVGDAIEVLDQRAQRVAVGSDENLERVF